MAEARLRLTNFGVKLMIATPPDKYRLLTRSDMDGLICAVLLRELNLLGEVVFHHPKDVQDGKVEVHEHDIVTNLPYIPGCALCFDHHSSEAKRNLGFNTPGYVLHANAKSAARVVYDYYGGAAAFPNISKELMDAVDRADSADFSREDVLYPSGWALMSFLMDARSGLGRYKDYRISNYQLMEMLIDACRSLSVDEILELPDVQERTTRYFAQQEAFEAQLRRVGQVHDNLVVLDLRDEDPIYVGNRFVVYTVFPQCDISMHVMRSRQGEQTAFTVGKSIFGRRNAMDIGALMLDHGGGGHDAAGACQAPNASADQRKQRLTERIVALSRLAQPVPA